MRAVCVSSAGREGSQKQTQRSAEASPVSSPASGTCQGGKDGSPAEPGEGFGYWGHCWVRGTVQGPGHSSSLVCWMGFRKALEAFLCPPVHAGLVQLNIILREGKRGDCLVSLDQDMSLPQLLYAPSTLLLKSGIASDGATAHQNSGWQLLAGADTCGWTGVASAHTVPHASLFKLFLSMGEYIIYDSIFLSVWRAFIKSIRELIRSLLFFHYLPKPWCIYTTQIEWPPVNGIRGLK